MAIKNLSLSISITRLALLPFVRGSIGFENIPRGACVIAANHSSLIDGVVVVTEFIWNTYRPLHMVSIAQPFNHPVFGWFLRSARCIPLRKASHSGTREMMQTALGYLAMNEAVGILPEGHVGSHKRLRCLRPGAALLALESGAPIIPVGIRGAYDILPLGVSRPKFKRKIMLKVGKPIVVDELHNAYHHSDIGERMKLVKVLLAELGDKLAELSGKEPPREVRKRV